MHIQSVQEFQKWMHILFLGDFFSTDEKSEIWSPQVGHAYSTYPDIWYGLGWDLILDPQAKKIKQIFHTGEADYGFMSIAGYDLENRAWTASESIIEDESASFGTTNGQAFLLIGYLV